MRICSFPVQLAYHAEHVVRSFRGPQDRRLENTLLTSHAASRNQSWPHHPPTDQTGDRDTAASFLYSTPRRSHQQQPQLARLQSSESRGSRVRSAGLPSLASSPTRSFAAAEDQQAVEQPRPPAKHPSPLLPTRPPAARRAARIRRPRSAAAASPGGSPYHARVGLSPAVPRGLRWPPVSCPVGADVLALGACQVLPLGSPSRVSFCGPPVLLISVGGFEVRCFSSRSISMELGPVLLEILAL